MPPCSHGWFILLFRGNTAAVIPTKGGGGWKLVDILMHCFMSEQSKPCRTWACHSWKWHFIMTKLLQRSFTNSLICILTGFVEKNQKKKKSCNPLQVSAPTYLTVATESPGTDFEVQANYSSISSDATSWYKPCPLHKSLGSSGVCPHPKASIPKDYRQRASCV